MENFKTNTPGKNAYLNKFIRECTVKETNTNHKEKLGYIKELTFNTNRFEMVKKFTDFIQLKQDFENIIQQSKNLYICLTITDKQEEKNGNSKDDEAITRENSLLTNELNSIFGENRIILKSSKIYYINTFKKSFKFFLVNSNEMNQKAYVEKQKENLAYINNHRNKLTDKNDKFIIENMFIELHRINILKTIYEDLFEGNNPLKFRNFTETNKKKDKITTLGFYKNSFLNDEKTGEIITLQVPDITQIFSHNNDKKYKFKLIIKTSKYYVPNNSTYTSYIKRMNDETKVEISIYSNIKKVNNFSDKNSITFSHAKFKESKYHLYCEILKTIEKNSYVRNTKTNLEKSYPIHEDKSFYRNNISGKITIGFIYEKSLAKEASETLRAIKKSIPKNTIKKKDKDTSIPLIEHSNLIFKSIEIIDNQDINKTIKKIERANCDGFICFNDIGDYKMAYDKKYELISKETVDYYKHLKEISQNNIIEGKKPIITQGILSNKTRNIYKLIENEGMDTTEDEYIIDDIEDTYTDIENKIDVVVQEILTKIIFYSNTIKFNSTFKNGEYGLIGFDSSSKKASFIHLKTENNQVHILHKDIFSTIETEYGSQLRNNEKIMKWVSKNLNADTAKSKEILNRISSYEDFIIYDFKQKSFLACCNENTYLLSDEDYEMRLSLLDEKSILVTKRNQELAKKFIETAKDIEQKILIENPSSSYVLNLETEAKKKTDLSKVRLLNNKDDDAKIKLEIDKVIADYKTALRNNDGFMATAIPLYNIPSTTDEQILTFYIDNQLFYFTSFTRSKKTEHKQSPLIKVFFSENNPDLKDFYFSSTNNSLIRNGLNSKTTIWQKISNILLKN